MSASPHDHAALTSAPPCVVTEAEQARWLAEEVRPHEPALRNFLRSKFPSLDADDVVQESYLKLLKARTAGGVASAKAFLFTVARNTAVTLFRRRQFYSEQSVAELPEWRVLEGGLNSAEVANAHLRFELVVAAIGRLPRRCREIVTLLVVDGCSYPEVAQKLGIAENTVRVQVARGLEKIAAYVRERGEG